MFKENARISIKRFIAAGFKEFNESFILYSRGLLKAIKGFL
jgi:hypothetical protein